MLLFEYFADIFEYSPDCNEYSIRIFIKIFVCKLSQVKLSHQVTQIPEATEVFHFVFYVYVMTLIGLDFKLVLLKDNCRSAVVWLDANA